MPYKLSMKLNDSQLTKIKEACETVDYGSVTIKLNKTLKFVDIVVEQQIRLQNEPTVSNATAKEKRYEK
jgi:hypothetical protein